MLSSMVSTSLLINQNLSLYYASNLNKGRKLIPSQEFNTKVGISYTRNHGNQYQNNNVNCYDRSLV